MLNFSFLLYGCSQHIIIYFIAVKVISTPNYRKERMHAFCGSSLLCNRLKIFYEWIKSERRSWMTFLLLFIWTCWLVFIRKEYWFEWNGYLARKQAYLILIDMLLNWFDIVLYRNKFCSKNIFCCYFHFTVIAFSIRMTNWTLTWPVLGHCLLILTIIKILQLTWNVNI